MTHDIFNSGSQIRVHNSLHHGHTFEAQILVLKNIVINTQPMVIHPYQQVNIVLSRPYGAWLPRIQSSARYEVQQVPLILVLLAQKGRLVRAGLCQVLLLRASVCSQQPLKLVQKIDPLDPKLGSRLYVLRKVVG